MQGVILTKKRRVKLIGKVDITMTVKILAICQLLVNPIQTLIFGWVGWSELNANCRRQTTSKLSFSSAFLSWLTLLAGYFSWLTLDGGLG